MQRIMISIIFISSLAFYQYGKIVDYIGCRINNITSTVARCDCEKLGKDIASTGTSPLSPKSTIKEKADDLFINYYGRISANIISVSPIKRTVSHTVLANGCNSTIFQPPRS